MFNEYYISIIKGVLVFTSPTQINIKTFFVNIDIIVKLYDGTPTFLTFTSDVRNARVKLDGYIFKEIYF